MIFIDRLGMPENLEKKWKIWTDNFIASGKNRPNNSQYAHQKIRDVLLTMSHSKCFYCERKLKGIVKEVDHYVEVAERKDLAFKWTNLYLACNYCNRKIANKDIPVEDTLDPCFDTNEIIQKHLDFEGEVILAKNGSVKGDKTIRKYKLGLQSMDYLRLISIKKYTLAIDTIKDRLIADGRKLMTTSEINILKRFAQKDHPFSLMFKILLEKQNIK